jgi:phenylacetic acid degradation operon negative regulatory protein
MAARTEESAARIVSRLLAERPPRAASLVVSVFGDVVIPHGGAVWLGCLIRWLAPFGVNERAVRTAMHRLTAEEWFKRRSVGRRSDYLLTETSRHRFADAERRIYAAAPHEWHGTWSIVVLGDAGMGSHRRDAVRRELRWHGFGELAPTVLLHPSADLGELELALADLGVDHHAIVLRAVREERVPSAAVNVRELVASAWDLRDLASEYGAYLRRFSPLLHQLRERPRPSSDVCFRIRVLAIHEYRRVLLRDPELPPALLPERWVGLEARAICGEIYRRVVHPATAYVLETGATAAGRLPAGGLQYGRRFRDFGALRWTEASRSGK